MKKKLVLLSIFLLLAFSKSVFASPFAGGKGTKSSPYQIKTLFQFREIKNYNGCYFIQKANIDGGGKTIEPLFDFTNAFVGKYNGNGKTIKNLKIRTADENGYKYTGLFGIIDKTGNVSNLKISNLKLLHNKNTIVDYGAISSENFGVIKNITATNIKATMDDPYPQCKYGGLVGINEGGTIVDCTIKNFYAINKWTGYAGGIAGANMGIIKRCKLSGIYLFSGSVGSIAGSNNKNGLISNCYVFRPVSYYQSAKTGTFVGYNMTGGIVKNCKSYF